MRQMGQKAVREKPCLGDGIEREIRQKTTERGRMGNFVHSDKLKHQQSRGKKGNRGKGLREYSAMLDNLFVGGGGGGGGVLTISFRREDSVHKSWWKKSGRFRKKKWSHPLYGSHRARDTNHTTPKGGGELNGRRVGRNW